MPAPLRRTLLCLLVAGLAFLAHAPLFGSGFVGGDLDLLAAAAGREELRFPTSAWLAEGEVRPIPAAILRAHADLHAGLSPIEPVVAAPYFAFVLVVLLLAAGGAGVTLRRVLVPWLGESAARGAGWACAGFVVAHPASVAAVARPIALGDVVALALGTWCTAFFLRGRQQRRNRFLVIASVLAIAAGFASSAAWLLPFACAALEFTSAHRPRALWRRLAAAATVALVASVAVALEAGFAWSHGFGFREGTPVAAFATSGFDAEAALSALGVLFVPVPSPGVAFAYLGCGAVLLLAAEPLLRAARAAPRLWGWLVLGWMTAIGVALFVARDLDVPPGRVELASGLLPATILVCAALATAATALGGSRRTVMPLAIAAILCLFSERTARIWPERSRELLALRADLERGLATAGDRGAALVVGAPEPESNRLLHGIGRGGFGAPLDLDLLAGAWPPQQTWPRRLRRSGAEDVPYVVRMPFSASVRESGLAVLLLDRADRPAFRFPPPNGDAKPFIWREDGRSDLVDLDPIALTMVRVTPRTGISTAEPPRMRWRAKNEKFEHGAIQGAWVATDDGPQAVFDLWRSTEWLLGDRIKRVWFEGELLKIVTAEVLPEVPLEGLSVTDAGFEFYLSESKRPRAWSGDLGWLVLVVDEAAGLVWQLDSANVRADGSPVLRFDPSYCFADVPLSAGSRIVECRVGNVTIARTRPLRWPVR